MHSFDTLCRFRFLRPVINMTSDENNPQCSGRFMGRPRGFISQSFPMSGSIEEALKALLNVKPR